MNIMLHIRDIAKQYRKDNRVIEALAPVSLNVSSGEFVAVEGPSGSGKTTLLLIAGGLLRPDHGSVSVHDQDVHKMSSAERLQFRAKNIGFVFQQYHLIAYLTVLENILAPGIARSESGNMERAEMLIEQFGLQHRKRHLPSELSAGEKQRTALARALVGDPKLLLADEITGNLDKENLSIKVKQQVEKTISRI